MKIAWYALCESRNFNEVLASVWIRCLQLIPRLEAMGFGCTLNDTAAAADVCVFVRSQDAHAQALATACKRQGARVVFDLCVDYTRRSGPVTQENVDEARRMISIADAVTCASGAITDAVAALHPRTICLPDSVDPTHFSVRKNPEDFSRPALTAVWAGVSAKARELVPILPLLRERNMKLRIISDAPPRLRMPGITFWRRYPIEFVKWRYEQFPADIVGGDICVASRDLTTAYNRGHSAFKIAVFLAEGVPVLASPVPSYVRLLTKGGGCVCETPEQWAAALDEVGSHRNRLIAWSREAFHAAAPVATPVVVRRYAELFRQLADA